MLQGQVPDGEGLKLGIAGIDAPLVIVIQLTQAGSHFAAAGAGSRYHDQGMAGLNVVIFAQALIADDMGHIGGISGDGIVPVAADPQLFQPVKESVRRILSAVTGQHHAAHIQPHVPENINQAEDVLIIGDTQIPPHFILLNVPGVDGDDAADVVLHGRLLAQGLDRRLVELVRLYVVVAPDEEVGAVGTTLLLAQVQQGGDDILLPPHLGEDLGVPVLKGHDGLQTQGVAHKGSCRGHPARLFGKAQIQGGKHHPHPVDPVLDEVHNLPGLFPLGRHLGALHHGVAVAHGISTGVDDVDMEGFLGLGVVLEEFVPGLDGILIGGRALGVDGGVDEVGVPLLPGLFKALLEHKGGQLGVGGNLGGRQKHAVKLLGGKVHAVPVLLVSHGDGEGKYLDVQLLPESGGNISGGISQKFNVSHSGLLH